MNARIVIIYEKHTGQEPFKVWLNSLDTLIRARIKARVDRLVVSGNFGDWKYVNNGVFEMRLDFGAGYRIYYAMPADPLVIILCGGTKRAQDKDVKIAIGYLKDFKNKHEIK